MAVVEFGRISALKKRAAFSATLMERTSVFDAGEMILIALLRDRLLTTLVPSITVAVLNVTQAAFK
jgi:hypothetical protein